MSLNIFQTCIKLYYELGNKSKNFYITLMWFVFYLSMCTIVILSIAVAIRAFVYFALTLYRIHKREKNKEGEAFRQSRMGEGGIYNNFSV